jgi:hypothetical protein
MATAAATADSHAKESEGGRRGTGTIYRLVIDKREQTHIDIFHTYTAVNTHHI